MSGNNSTMNPESREAMERFKMEDANEVGVSLKKGYNGDLNSRQTGFVGGQMVKNVCPARLVRNVQFIRDNRVINGRKMTVKYIVGVAV